jgi:dTDP-4-dehydrorhamnose reductase
VTPRKVAITGGGGQLGRQLTSVFAADGWQVASFGHAQLDIDDPSALELVLDERPEVVANAAAWTDVDGCARDPERAMQINGEAAGRVAAAAHDVGALAVQVSTNEVFDGERVAPYAEDDPPNPINPYGASKLRGELEVAEANARHLIVRTAWIFGPGGRNFPSKIVELARRQVAAGEPLRVVADEFGNPTWAPDLANGILRAVRAVLDGQSELKILHLAGEPATSRFGWAEEIVGDLGDVRLEPIPAAEFPRPSRVPRRAVLTTDRALALGIQPSDWRAATRTFVAGILAATSS